MNSTRQVIIDNEFNSVSGYQDAVSASTMGDR